MNKLSPFPFSTDLVNPKNRLTPPLERWFRDLFALLNKVDNTISPTGTIDHGLLTGLSDDDHPQYHNNTRGDLRYAPLSSVHSPVTVADTDDVDLSVTGQQISANTIGYTGTINFTAGY